MDLSKQVGQLPELTQAIHEIFTLMNRSPTLLALCRNGFAKKYAERDEAIDYALEVNVAKLWQILICLKDAARKCGNYSVSGFHKAMWMKSGKRGECVQFSFNSEAVAIAFKQELEKADFSPFIAGCFVGIAYSELCFPNVQ